MPNFGNIFKSEIGRLSRRALRPLFLPIKKDVAALKHMVAHQKRVIAGLTRDNARLIADLNGRTSAPKLAPDHIVAKSHLSPRLIGAQRKRLGLSRKDFARLLGTSPGSVFQWEAGRSKPREKAKAALVGIREVGRREARARLLAFGDKTQR